MDDMLEESLKRIADEMEAMQSMLHTADEAELRAIRERAKLLTERTQLLFSLRRLRRECVQAPRRSSASPAQ